MSAMVEWPIIATLALVYGWIAICLVTNANDDEIRVRGISLIVARSIVWPLRLAFLIVGMFGIGARSILFDRERERRHSDA